MRIAITGSKGQLGSYLEHQFREHDLLSIDVPEYDITRVDSITPAIVQFEPDVVIHTAAYTNVDGCAKDPDLAFRVNALGTQNVALACQKANAAMVHISTNEVFDGRKGAAYLEYEDRNPIKSLRAHQICCGTLRRDAPESVLHRAHCLALRPRRQQFRQQDLLHRPGAGAARHRHRRDQLPHLRTTSGRGPGPAD